MTSLNYQKLDAGNEHITKEAFYDIKFNVMPISLFYIARLLFVMLNNGPLWLSSQLPYGVTQVIYLSTFVFSNKK